MIGYLRGTVYRIQTDTVFMDVNGLGYRLQMPLSQMDQLPRKGEEFLVYTHLIMKDDSLSLYGFIEERALDIFRMLLAVSGVGPKMALNILSVVPVDDLVQGISVGDLSRLQTVHGVGKKTAARICVDLKEKALKYIRESGIEPKKGEMLQSDGVEDAGLVADAVSALSNLGYRPSRAKRAVRRVLDRQGAGDINLVIKSALQALSRVGAG